MPKEPITMTKLSQFVNDCIRFTGESPKILRFGEEDFERYIEIITPENSKIQLSKSDLRKMQRRKTFFFRGIKICQKK